MIIAFWNRTGFDMSSAGRIIIYYYLLFSHLILGDAFIQSDLQTRTTEAINWSIKTTENIQN